MSIDLKTLPPVNVIETFKTPIQLEQSIYFFAFPVIAHKTF